MPTKEHLLNQVVLIAERKRNEPGELHPFRKHRLNCKGCGKEIGIIERNLLPEGNYCQQCRGKHDKNWIQKITARAKNRSPEWKTVNTNNNRVNGKKYEIRKKIACTKQGCSIDEFTGFASDEDYCHLWREPIREKTRALFNNHCCLPDCGKTMEENGGKKMDVHHVFMEKKACCETRIEEMEAVRRRLPKVIARFGEPTFSEEEIKYIRMMVPLCHSCHSKLQKEKRDLPFDRTVYRKQFVDLLLIIR